MVVLLWTNSSVFAQEEFQSLEEFELVATSRHPTLQQIQMQIQAAHARANQALLKSNPTVGVFGDEVGNANEALAGAYLQQNIRLGGKRFINHEVQSREAMVLGRQYDQQSLRIQTDVRTAFYNLLIAQRRLELSIQLRDAQTQAANLIKERFDSGEAPKVDYFQAQLRADQSSIQTRQNEIAIEGAWRELAALVGIPDMEVRPINGSLDDIPQLIEWENAKSNLAAASPEILAAQEQIRKADAAYRAACANSIPNLQTQFRLGHDSGTDDLFGGVQVGVPLQIYNRNQGNIAAAQAELEQARNGLRSVELSLQKRLAKEYRAYRQAWEQTNVYSQDLMPTAKKTLDLVTDGYREGETSFLQLLAAQQTMIDLTFQYLDNLQLFWQSHQRINGLLLSGSLD